MRVLGSLALLLLAGCTRATPDPTRDAAPLEFTLPRYPEQVPFSLASERGHVVMLDVWATWCEPCRESLPQYQALMDRFGKRGLRLYAFNVDGEAAVAAEFPRFIAETKLTLPILLDTDGKLAEGLLKVKVMPTAVLIDRRGRVRHVHEGFVPTSLAEVTAQLESLLDEP